MAEKLSILSISPVVCITLAFAVLFLPIEWVFAWFFAAAVHETFHSLLIIITGGVIHHIHIGLNGMYMTTTTSSLWTEAICAIAGPMGGVLLILLGRWLPRIAVCALIQTAYNLLPIYPMDGGRTIYALFRSFLPENKATKWMRIASAIILGVLLCLCLHLAFVLTLGPIPIFCFIFMFIKSLKIKIPCKEELLRVQ